MFRARCRYAQGLGYGTKLAFFLGAICVEKVTLVGEILPVGIVLPALSPVLFGGVAQARAQFSSARQNSSGAQLDAIFQARNSARNSLTRTPRLASAQGTIISALCAAIGSSLNFVLGRTYLKEKLLGLEVFGQPPVAEAGWFRALSANIEKDGFRAALLLRLAPVLPIPIDAHWCGPRRASDIPRTLSPTHSSSLRSSSSRRTGTCAA